jgi:hypothetical protein
LYLSLPIGGDPRRLSFWDPMVNKIHICLSGWNSRFLSFGGRLVLLKSVMTSLSVYVLQHLFLSCPFFASLWSLIRSWVGISSADPFCFVIILFSLPMLHKVYDNVAYSCRFFGYVAFGWFGRNGTVDFLRRRNQRSLKC